jgi:hypothetical protein
MKGKELAELAMQYPDFEFEFCFTDGGNKFPNIRNFDHLEVTDVGNSDKVIVLTGEER